MGRTAWTDGVEQVAHTIVRHAVDGAAETACNALTIKWSWQRCAQGLVRRETANQAGRVAQVPPGNAVYHANRADPNGTAGMVAVGVVERMVQLFLFSNIKGTMSGD